MKRMKITAGVLVFISLAFFSTKPVFAATGQWYKGDLHAHSFYSDGDSSVPDVVGMAEALGFDFFALTDHDVNMNGTPTHWSDPAYTSEKLTLLYGVEWTTDKGHANVWAAAPFDYSELWEANGKQDLKSALRSAHAHGAIFSVNHPTAYLCCPWKYPVYDTIDAMEVWNSMYRIPNFNPWAVGEVWDHVLMSGQKLPCVGGSDTHELKGIQSFFFGLGNPTTWVFAKDASPQSILEAIKAGHTSLSYAAGGPRVMFSADRDNDGEFETQVGDNLAGSSPYATFQIEIADQGDSEYTGDMVIPLNAQAIVDLKTGAFWMNGSIRKMSLESELANLRILGVIKNGTLFKAWILTGESPVVTFTDIVGDLDYYRVMLYGKPQIDSPLEQLLYGRLLGMTSPIYVGFHSDEASGDMQVYFGNLHSHSGVSDGNGTQQEAFTWARDVAGYDFYVITDHAEYISPREWRETGDQADIFNEKGRFVAMRGFEWSHPLAGHINVYNTSSYTNIFLTPDLFRFYNWLDNHNGLAQFNHPGREPLTFQNFRFDESVFDNFFAMETGNKDAGNLNGEYLAYYPQALSKGWCLAPTSNQDNHTLSSNSHRTAVIATELSRGGLIDAMKNRRIYSTDDPNIQVVFKQGSSWMGSQVVAEGETIGFVVDVADDEYIEKIELIHGKGNVVAVKIPDIPTDKIQWRPEMPALQGAYYIKITSENWYDEPSVEPSQITVTAPIQVHKK